MTTLSPTAGPAARTTTPAAASRGTFPQLLAMEWTKLRSLRSTALTMLLGIVLINGVTGLDAYENPDRTVEYLMQVAAQVLPLFSLTLGALTITGEYASGMIHTTIAAAPQRGRMLAAKGTVLAAATWAFGAAVAAACGLVGSLLVDGGFDASAGTTVRALAAAGTWTMAAAVLTFGLGTLLRSTAGAVVLTIVLIFLLPDLIKVVSEEFAERVMPYLLASASDTLLTGAGDYGRWAAVGIIGAWVAAAVAAGYGRLKRRDV